MLHNVYGPTAKGIGVLAHARALRASGRRWVQPCSSQVILQAHPGGRHFGNGGEPRGHQVAKTKVWVRSGSHEVKRVPGNCLGESDQRRAIGPIEMLHHSHRPTPGDIRPTVKQAEHSLLWGGCAVQLNIESFAFKPAGGYRRIVRGIEDGPQAFQKTYTQILCPRMPKSGRDTHAARYTTKISYTSRLRFV
jgi:hypothetical protein